MSMKSLIEIEGLAERLYLQVYWGKILAVWEVYFTMYTFRQIRTCRNTYGYELTCSVPYNIHRNYVIKSKQLIIKLVNNLREHMRIHTGEKTLSV